MRSLGNGRSLAGQKGDTLAPLRHGADHPPDSVPVAGSGRTPGDHDTPLSPTLQGGRRHPVAALPMLTASTTGRSLGINFAPFLRTSVLICSRERRRSRHTITEECQADSSHHIRQSSEVVSDSKSAGRTPWMRLRSDRQGGRERTRPSRPGFPPFS